jgi:hypothetical protein
MWPVVTNLWSVDTPGGWVGHKDMSRRSRGSSTDPGNWKNLAHALLYSQRFAPVSFDIICVCITLSISLGISISMNEPIPVAAQCKAWVCGRLHAGIAGSKPAGGMDVCLLWVLRIVRYRGVPATSWSLVKRRSTVCRVSCVWVWSRSLYDDEALVH